MSSGYKHDRDGEPVEAPFGQPDAAAGSEMLRDRILLYFAKWESRNGFNSGAGIILVPAGWRP